MKNSTTYLKEKLLLIIQEFTDIQIRYEYRETIESHIVEIIPNELFENNNFIMKEAELTKAFFEKFPKEELIFISEESVLPIEKVDFELSYDDIYQERIIPYQFSLLIDSYFTNINTETCLSDSDVSFDLAA